MADKKISAMTYMSASNADKTADWIPYVDVSDVSDSNKKINVNELMSISKLTQNTTVNFSSSMSATSIQSLIDAQPKYLNGYNLVFQFGNGVYTLTSGLNFNYFYAGSVLIQCNMTENTLHTNQAVDLDASAATSDVIYSLGCSRVEIYNIKTRLKSSNSTPFSGINIYGAVSFDIRYCYVLGNSTTYGNGIQIKNSQGIVYSNYVSNMAYGILASYTGQIYSNTNADTGTKPLYGLYAASATIMKFSTQPSGSNSNESTTGGGIIR